MSRRVGHWSKKQGAAVMGLALVAFAASLAAAPRDAKACGACFTSATESTVVSDHKMALKITNQQTILWDQITYTGNPKEFAYVVPARPGTKLEASNDGFFTALDLTSRPIIMAPQPPASSYSSDDGCSPGCGMSSSEATMSAGASSSGGESVQIVKQEVVGPYETVTLRSTDPRALHEWLNQHGYAMPENATPIIEQYVAGGFDFIALRLVPGKDVRAMKPIRIVSPTPDAELPLRMMQIGAGPKVGITLYVLAEGRYQPSNFPVASIDRSKLIWDSTQKRSNYQELSLRAMNEREGRSMLVEYANKANVVDSGYAYTPTPGGGMGANPSLPDAYRGACTEDTCDDLETLFDGMSRSDLWITRLRSNLPNAALAETLRLEATKQEAVDNVYQTTETGTITARVARSRPSRWYGSATIIATTMLVFSRIVRRRQAAK